MWSTAHLKSVVYNVRVFQVGCPEEMKKMGVVLVCTSNYYYIHLKWVSFSSGYLSKQGPPLHDNQL